MLWSQAPFEKLIKDIKQQQQLQQQQQQLRRLLLVRAGIALRMWHKEPDEEHYCVYSALYTKMQNLCA